jgi:hypothetical protein
MSELEFASKLRLAITDDELVEAAKDAVLGRTVTKEYAFTKDGKRVLLKERVTSTARDKRIGLGAADKLFNLGISDSLTKAEAQKQFAIAGSERPPEEDVSIIARKKPVAVVTSTSDDDDRW